MEKRDGVIATGWAGLDVSKLKREKTGRRYRWSKRECGAGGDPGGAGVCGS